MRRPDAASIHCLVAFCLLVVACSENGSGDGNAGAGGGSGGAGAGGAAGGPGDIVASPNGNENYGDDIIGYKNATDGPQNASLYDGDMAASGVPYEVRIEAGAGGAIAYAGGTGGTAGSGYYDAGVSIEPDAGVEDAGWQHDVDGGMGIEPEAGVEDAGWQYEVDGGVGIEPEAGGGTVGPEPSADAGPTADSEPPVVDEDRVPENPYRHTDREPVSTFSIDVDTGSYTLSRGYLASGNRPPAESVRIEEFINYFHFHYRQPEGDVPFSLYTEMGDCPWNTEHKLVMMGIQGQEVALQDQPPANLVFLLDVSGSMSSLNKLPLLKKAFRMLVRQLRDQDRVAIVTYAGSERVALGSTPGSEKETILAALDQLQSGGSTNGAGGIQKAYEIAAQYFIEGGNNRVLLATDGDFNVGISDTDALVDFIATKRETGVFLSVYGFGDAWNGGNYQDVKMEQLADNGNGIYFYIDGPEEARRAFLHTVSGSLLTIAKDVKVQVEFNPDQVKAYRLIGYENRMLANEDFSNDTVDAGELGAGLSVTALFEIIPAGSAEEIPEPIPGTVPVIESADGGSDAAEGSAPAEQFEPVTGEDLFAVRIRYKDPDADASRLIAGSYDGAIERPQPSVKFFFAAAVSEFAMQLRYSQYISERDAALLMEQVDLAAPLDAEGAVAEFRGMIEMADALP